MGFDLVRAKVVRAVALLGVLVLAGWWLLRAEDVRAESASTAAAAAALDSKNAEARAAAVAIGDSALSDSIRVARERYAELQVRVPAASSGDPAASMVQLFRQVAESAGVEVRRQEAIAPATEGEFVSEGVRICAVGSFHSVGAWLAQAVTSSQLVQIREVSLDAVPDSLLLQAPAQPGGSEPPVAGPCAQGERPFHVVASVALRWFRHAAPTPEPSTVR